MRCAYLINKMIFPCSGKDGLRTYYTYIFIGNAKTLWCLHMKVSNIQKERLKAISNDGLFGFHVKCYFLLNFFGLFYDGTNTWFAMVYDGWKCLNKNLLFKWLQSGRIFFLQMRNCSNKKAIIIKLERFSLSLSHHISYKRAYVKIKKASPLTFY